MIKRFLFYWLLLVICAVVLCFVVIGMANIGGPYVPLFIFIISTGFLAYKVAVYT